MDQEVDEVLENKSAYHLEKNFPISDKKSFIHHKQISSTYHAVLYEHPLNEHTRVCLRLEMLFNKAQALLHGTSPWDSHHCVATIIDIVSILDRPDLKSKLTQEFKSHITHLNRLENAPNIDQEKLQHFLNDLEELVEIFHNAHGKLAPELRDNEFLNHIRQHLLSAGGTCSFDTPGYHYWLEQSVAARQADLNRWLNSLDTVHIAVTQLLKLTRESGTSRLVTAFQGFYQTSLDSPCKLLQVRLPTDLCVFPEISAGRHRLCVRFLVPSVTMKPSQYKDDVTFEMTYCSL